MRTRAACRRARGRRHGGLIAAVLCLAWFALGCGSPGAETDPLQEGRRNTLQGSYQVKAMEKGKVLGVGIYDNGSFRLILEGAPTMIIYNSESGQGWMVNFHTKTSKEISYDEAAKRAGFMPHVVMKPYFGVERYWGEEGFRMDTPDGRSIRAYLDRPHYLPSAWEARSRDGIIKRIDWQYRRVGAVSPENFELPGGLSPQP